MVEDVDMWSLNSMNEKAALFAVHTCDGLKWLVAEAAHEALELIVVYNAEREEWGCDTRTEHSPHGVALLMNRGGPADYSHMGDEKLVPASHVLIHLEPKVVRSEEPMSCDELEVLVKIQLQSAVRLGLW